MQEITQSLYEKKLFSCPRTYSRLQPEDVYGMFRPVMEKLLSSKDAKNAYVHATAAGLRMKDSVMGTVATVQENAADILASAKDLNEARAAKEAEDAAAANLDSVEA